MKKLLFLMAAFALSCNTLDAQHLHRVNNNTDFDADFTTLQDAVDAAADHDTIYVEGSATPYLGATINKPLTIVGPGYFLDENPETQAIKTESVFSRMITFESGSEGSAIMGCQLEYTVLAIAASDIKAIRNYLYSVDFTDNCSNILLSQNYITLSISAVYGSITNSIISNNIIGRQLGLSNASGSFVVSNNVFISTAYSFPIDVNNASIQNNILAYEQAGISENTGNSISYNIMAADGANANGNQYNIDMDKVFADFDESLKLSTDGKWELKEDSPAIGAGVGGEECGAFGGPSPYILSGIPGLPHIYEAEVPAAATSESGLQVIIKVKR